jgi:hypothetical protein
MHARARASCSSGLRSRQRHRSSATDSQPGRHATRDPMPGRWHPGAVAMGPVEALIVDAWHAVKPLSECIDRARELDRELAREAETKPDLSVVPDGAPKPKGAR